MDEPDAAAQPFELGNPASLRDTLNAREKDNVVGPRQLTDLVVCPQSVASIRRIRQAGCQKKNFHDRLGSLAVARVCARGLSRLARPARHPSASSHGLLA